MKSKTFTAMGQAGLDKKVNRFLANLDNKVVSVKFAVGFGYVGAMILYE